MKIQYISDLHLEFLNNREYIKHKPIIPSADYLVIAGDTGYLTTRRKNHIYEKHTDFFFDYCSKNWKEVIVIPGNHEWYAECPMSNIASEYKLADNITFLNNGYLYLSTQEKYDIGVWGGTLWSNIPRDSYGVIAQSMNDYQLINYAKNVKLTPGMSMEKHFMSCSSIAALPSRNFRLTEGHLVCDPGGSDLKRKPFKLLIVTHHGCHPNCINEMYNDSVLNNAYSTDLSDLIDVVNPEAWIYGHTHYTQSFRYKDTVIAENSLGYVNSEECNHFKHDLTLEL